MACSFVSPFSLGLKAYRPGPSLVGVIGCGNVNFHLPAYAAHPELSQVVGLVHPTAERLELARDAVGLAADLRARASVATDGIGRMGWMWA